MGRLIVLGLQWGDEGKGKIVDLLCPAFDAVVRYQGGHNAGHTVRFGDRHFALHLIPSGILHPGIQCLLGNGMVVSPEAFFHELEGLEQAGVEAQGRLFLAERAHVLLPLYAAIDQIRERALGARAIGTTSRGIGPAYEAKAARSGVRFCDLFATDLAERLEPLLDRLGVELVRAGDPAPSLEAAVEEASSWRERLAPYLTDGQRLVASWIRDGRGVLFEGAQGALLDLDHGTYPYVTSSHSTAAGACAGAGVPPTRIDGVMGVLKAYTSRVGGGPFVTELEDETGEYLRRRGNEFGTTTGRPRRCGWLDLVAVRHAVEINDATSVALTKLDVLDELDVIRVCTAYRLDGREVEHLPATTEELERCTPVYRDLAGWRTPTVGTLDFDALQAQAKDYVGFLERELGVTVHLVSTGPRREETVLRVDPWLESILAGRLEPIQSQLAG
ncbi:MAG: adenylosuccinate synthase [Thermoanaerobaculia bacterium]